MNDFRTIVDGILRRVAEGRMSVSYAADLLGVTFDELKVMMERAGLGSIDL